VLILQKTGNGERAAFVRIALPPTRLRSAKLAASLGKYRRRRVQRLRACLVSFCREFASLIFRSFEGSDEGFLAQDERRRDEVLCQKDELYGA
jgi:hypothetical protein